MRNTGLMDRIIDIKQYTYVADEFGASGEKTWTTLAQEYARMITGVSSESVKADQVSSTYPVTWEIHYRDDVDESMRIEYKGKQYEIKGIREVVRNQFLEIQTELVK